jgi:hypothetical protein
MQTTRGNPHPERFNPELGDAIAALAIETGLWPLKEAIDGKLRHTSDRVHQARIGWTTCP